MCAPLTPLQGEKSNNLMTLQKDLGSLCTEATLLSSQGKSELQAELFANFNGVTV